MTVYLIRHAQAGSRQSWDGDDIQRPLTGFGRHQSADLVGVLADVALSAIYSSPYLRCIETVAPLAARRGLQLSVSTALEEGPAEAAIALLEECIGIDAVFCSHGDIVPELLQHLAASHGIDLGDRPRCQKGSMWIVEPDVTIGRFIRAEYVPPAHRSQ